MSILVDEKSRVVVQGITGREGMVRTRLMKDYGTNVVAGVTPGKGGGEFYGIPIFDTVEEAWEICGQIDISVIFVPAALVKNAALEAIDAGVRGYWPSFLTEFPFLMFLKFLDLPKKKAHPLLGQILWDWSVQGRLFLV
ncbi:hypothetical protein ACFLT2_14430 [Acidobacteriota bacterium]